MSSFFQKVGGVKGRSPLAGFSRVQPLKNRNFGTRKCKKSMLGFLLSPLYGLVCVYIVSRILRFLSAVPVRCFKGKRFKIIFSVLFGLVAMLPLWSYLLPLNTAVKHTGQLLNNYWVGILEYLFLTVTVTDLIVQITGLIKKDRKNFVKKTSVRLVAGTLALLVIAGVSTYGIVHARDIKLNEYSVKVNKKVDGLNKMKVVLIADLHMGYSIGTSHIEKMVKMVNEQKPDLVVMAGDIFDNDYDALDNPEKLCSLLASMKSTYGTYACWGNHDISETLFMGFTVDTDKEIHRDARMTDFLQKANIHLLCDENTLIDNKFYVSGRNDSEKIISDTGTRLTPDELLRSVDKKRPVFVIYHEPDEFEELEKAGCDVLLCGHTHNGQTFPGTLFIKLRWENPFGYLKIGNMHQITTSGIGVWGPYMRTATDSEVVSIDVTFD